MLEIVTAVLMLAPCPTDTCVETQSEPVYAFGDFHECVMAADTFNFTDDMHEFAWCAPTDEGV